MKNQRLKEDNWLSPGLKNGTGQSWTGGCLPRAWLSSLSQEERTGLALTDHNLTQSHPFTASYKQHQVVEKTTMGHLTSQRQSLVLPSKKVSCFPSPLMWIGLQNQVRLKQDTHAPLSTVIRWSGRLENSREEPHVLGNNWQKHLSQPLACIP